MKRITLNQFNAYCYARGPLVRKLIKEVAWFEVGDRKLLAAITLDLVDSDYGHILLGRDSRRMFRCISASKDFYKTIGEAEKNLAKEIVEYENDGHDIYPQGDEKKAPNEILVPVVDEEKLHPYFKVLINEPRLEAARNLIKEVVYSYVDSDGHYIKEFQTQGFDARIWELFLYVYLDDAGFEFIRGHPAPDYHVSFYGNECCIEAVTVNQSQNPERPDVDQPETQEDILKLTDNYLPIKFGSSLHSKLQKKYWEKDHVKDKPLIIAIHDFHMPGSMGWSRTALSEYLYGRRIRLVEVDGVKKYINEKIKTHKWEGKEIPSNFFGLPNSKYISAVLFTNAATITKFNRMGKLAGLGSKEVKLFRTGYRYNPDPGALEPIHFCIDVDDPEYEELWSDSLMMFHNPSALHPVDPDWFETISHTWVDKESGEFAGYHQPHDVISSVTMTLSSQPAYSEK
jgi:hypothetical protein